MSAPTQGAHSSVEQVVKRPAFADHEVSVRVIIQLVLVVVVDYGSFWKEPTQRNLSRKDVLQYVPIVLNRVNPNHYAPVPSLFTHPAVPPSFLFRYSRQRMIDAFRQMAFRIAVPFPAFPPFKPIWAKYFLIEFVSFGFIH